jgi:acyl-CoA synthetase (NDP forming)
MQNIANRSALAASILAMKNMIAARAPGAVIRFFLLEKMMPAGLELLIGGLRDQQFGPAVAFGLGGVWVEALQDAVFGILPMTRKEQLAMISETKAGAFMKGFRGSAPLDLEAALAAINAVSSLLTSHPEIVEVDLNPGPAVPEGRCGTGYEDRAAEVGGRLSEVVIARSEATRQSQFIRRRQNSCFARSHGLNSMVKTIVSA